MSFGLYCLCENGKVIDTSTITGVLQAALVLSTGASGTLSYPSLAGRTVFVFSIRNLTAAGSAYRNRSLRFDVSYLNGYPEISYSPIGSGADYLMNVFVLVK